MKNKQKVIDIFLILIFIILCISGIIFVKESKHAIEIKKEDQEVAEIVKKNINVEKGFNKDTFLALKELNSDLIGYIEFESGIISQPIVKAKNNEKYLNKSFNGNYSSQGSIFMDYQYDFSNQNPIVYGHNVFYDNDAKFSPLAKLLKQEFYEENNRFKIYTENEIRNYVITDVYVFDTEKNESFSYIKPNFENLEDFNDWYSTVSEMNYIKSINGFQSFDAQMITLQTCKTMSGPERIIVLAKLENVTLY